MKYEKWSAGYFLLKGYVKFAHWLIHKKIVVTGRKKLPLGKPVVFAPNHQNALCDPLAVLLNTPYQPVWLGRADIFNLKVARLILRFFKIMPVYRLRDGKENLGKNDLTFSDSIKVLEHNFALALFPEAAHSGRRQMIPHKKAVPRIVFMAEEKTGFNLDIQVVPVGIYYSHYWKFDRTQIVNIGNPIGVLDFENLYRENEFLATQALKEKIYKAILPLTININSDKFYDEFEQIRIIYGKYFLKRKKKKFSTLKLFYAEQELVGKLDELETNKPEEINEICSDVTKYMDQVVNLKLRDWLIDIKQNTFFKFVINVVLWIVGLPFFIYGGLLNILPFVLLDILVRKKVKNKVFWSTFFFAGGIILFPLFYGAELVIFSALLPGIIYKIAFLASLPITGKIAFKSYIVLRKLIGRIRLLRLKISDKNRYEELFKQKKTIIEKLDRLIPVSITPVN